MEVDRKLLEKIANSIMLELKKKHYKHVEEDINWLSEYVGKFKDLEGFGEAMPMNYPFPLEDVGLREDEVKEHLATDEVLANVAESEEGQVKISKVIR